MSLLDTNNREAGSDTLAANRALQNDSVSRYKQRLLHGCRLVKSTQQARDVPFSWTTMPYAISRPIADNWIGSATQRTFATPELLEHILSYLLFFLLPVTDKEDPRSVKSHGNTNILLQLLRCTAVSQDWRKCILGSPRLRRALYWEADPKTNRSWDVSASASRVRILYSYYTAPHLRAPQLNPIIQTTFPVYQFRFWHLNPHSTGNKHCAYLIITRRDVPAVKLREQTGLGRSISKMMLSQPPCTVLEATIWDERDESKDYIGRTTRLEDPVISCETGVTIGMIHDRVAKMFDEHRDVAAIKLTTM